MTFALFAFWAAAYMNDPPLKYVASEAPPIEVGVLAGRDGPLSVQELSCKDIWGDWVSMDSPGHRVSVVTPQVTESKQNLRDRTLGFGVQ